MRKNKTASHSPPVKELHRRPKSKEVKKLDEPVRSGSIHRHKLSQPYTDTSNENFGETFNRNSFEEKLLLNNIQESPRTAFQRARDQSIKDLNESIGRSTVNIDIQKPVASKEDGNVRLSSNAKKLRESIDARSRSISKTKVEPSKTRALKGYVPIRNKTNLSRDYTM